jgi:hypothetical protein
MLSKCINPGCAAKFAYLHQGKLFRWQTTGAAGSNDPPWAEDSEMKMPPRRVEFFWLCDECSASMTVSFDRKSGVTVRPLKRSAANAS